MFVASRQIISGSRFLLTEMRHNLTTTKINNMLNLSLVTLFIAAIALYISSKIKDDVFRAAMRFTSLTFSLVTLFCAPWILKLALVAIPMAIFSLNSFSTENF